MSPAQAKKQLQKQPQKNTKEQEVQPTDTEAAEKLKAELDELLESVDEALGDNLEFAEDFIRAFQQKGGE